MSQLARPLRAINFSMLLRQADVFLAFVLVTIVALLILPIPTLIIDLLICTNIASALILLLLSIYISDTLQLSSFPTILLVATLFRLGLNVATSRLILLHADAGQMILAFGNTVVGGNLVVGIVIFILLMLINMLVVAKGSERVAEVAARFTLDAMPGKQMSIDADLRAGIIDETQARSQRDKLSRESQLFGAMDGAMKFVKGDVIAGIIIFVVNIIAGLIIGVLDHGMSTGEALQTFVILSVGDGLVSIIPGLLMSVCSGLIVTRVESNNAQSNLGTNVATQVLSYPKAFVIASGFIALTGLLPGLPTIPLIILALVVCFLAYVIHTGLPQQNLAPEKTLEKFESQEDKGEPENISPQESCASPGIIPICIEVATNLVPAVDNSSNFINELIPLLRESLAMELGVDFPGIRVRPGPCGLLSDSQYRLLINEVPTEYGTAPSDKILVAAEPYNLKALGIEDAQEITNPANKTTNSLTHIDNKQALEEAGYMTWNAPSRILLHLSSILRRNAQDFITLHETQQMLDHVESQFPALVKEVIPKAVSITQLTDILKRLLSEEVSIKDIKTILQALAEHGPSEQNTIFLTEHVRCSIKRYLCHKLGNSSDTLLVFLLSPTIEDMIRSGIEHQSNGSYLALEPEISQDILEAIRKQFINLTPDSQNPVILTTQDIRRFVRTLIESEFFSVGVMCYQELSKDFNVQPIGRIMLSSEHSDLSLDTNTNLDTN